MLEIRQIILESGNFRLAHLFVEIPADVGADVDVLGAINRRRLLAEITFGPSAMTAGTAVRLAGQTFDIIDGIGPEVERIALLRLALNGLSDPALHDAMEKRVRRWAPRRLQYPSNLYGALQFWSANDTLLDILVAGLKDEDRNGARVAARVLAAKFAGQVEIGKQLRAMIGGNSDLSVVAAALQALVLGWPSPDTDDLALTARSSRSPLLRAVAIWAKVVGKTHDDADRAECLQMVGFDSPLDFIDRTIAIEALFNGWPDDDRIVVDAIQTLGHGPTPRDTIDRDLAVSYLLNSTPGRPSVEAWILEQLEQEHPFILLGGGTWAPLVTFCEASPIIRERVIARVTSGKQKFREREVWEIIARVKDARLRDHAIQQMESKERFGRYWSLLPLVEGWSNDPLVQTVFGQVIALEDSDLDMLAALLPRLYADPAEARTRLVRIAKNAPQARYDLIANALASIGVDGSDSEAVDALLPHAMGPSRTFASPDNIFAHFGSSPKVRQAAMVRLREAEPPIAHIARGMADDPAIRAYISDVVMAAPQSLRSAIVAACGTGADRHPSLFSLLADYDHEANFQLKVQLAIDFYKLKLARGTAKEAIPRLLEEADRRGPDYEENRASAFAGLVAIHSAGAIIKGEGKNRDISLGSYHRGGVSSALCNLVVENWKELKTVLGEDFAENRLKTLDGPAWVSLSRFVSLNASAKLDFISWCGKSDQIGLSALQTLAEVAPQSDILRTHVHNVLERGSSERDAIRILLTAATICRDQFASSSVVNSMRQRFMDRRDLASALALAVVAPDEPLLQDRQITALELGTDHDEWLGAVEMAARLEPAALVVEVIHAVAERRVYPRWDQGLALDALIDRVKRDATTRELLRRSLEMPLSPSAFCATASMLSAAGVLDSHGWIACAEKLVAEQASQNVPVAVLDIATDQVRPLSHVLTDLFQARSSL